MIEGAGMAKMTWKGMQIIDNMMEDFGLNPGKTFEKWLSDNLKAVGVKTLSDLKSRMQILPKGLRTRNGKKLTLKQAGSQLAIVAADVSTETKVVFPKMADLYFKNIDDVSPARFVRASMSIPGFFHPYHIKGIPQGAAAMKNWADKAGYTGRLPKEVFFVDGGIMSNFPINIFHSDGVPTAPTFGVKLGTERMEPHKIEKPLQLLGAIFNSARHCADFDFILRNPDYKNLVKVIDTGSHNWLNFFMKDDAKIDLFSKGVMAAINFLKGFDWKAYKKTRQNSTK
jgi:NTE family protein